MRKFTPIIFIIFLLSQLSAINIYTPNIQDNTNDSIENEIIEIWESSSFNKELSLQIFMSAMKGYYKYSNFKKGKISIIDYSKPSTAKRLYIINLNTKKIIFNTYVAHGKNSGENKAKYFSNKPNSKKSSLGFFKTAETYYGKHGYSLKLDGLEKGINDNARDRAIVIHGANYVCKEFIQKHGRLGRSWGCPAIPVDQTKSIIDSISNGYCLFISGDNIEYSNKSNY
jgi:hypothetical protein